ncbi:MAG: HAMP domain-containing histidine kinase [Candidatus Omnitrophica bacterium]|nr:HAMP domain-containing histidine kinase [Candidatus Omnitrophota bacterium]
MRITANTPVAEIQQRAYQLYLIRILTILILIPLYMLTCRWGNFSIDIWPLYLVIAVELFVNRPYAFLFRDSATGYQALIASVLIDFLSETAALHLLGNVDLFVYSSCYFISITYCALYLPAFMTLGLATLASALYAGLILAGHFGIIPQTIEFTAGLDLIQKTALVFRHIAFFYLIAIVVRFLASALAQKDARLEELCWELRETSDKVKYAHHLQTEYFARMSHEIRAPLNSILGFSELLLEPTTGPLTEKQKDFMTRIANSGKHLRDLINDVLDLSKLESKKAQLMPREIELARLIDSVIEVFRDEASRKKILLGFTEKPESLKVVADELKLRQVLYNLLSNALKFTPSGFVHITLKKSPQGAVITVEDSGAGIAPENQKSVFQPYEQAGRTTSKNIKGTGLGLAISKQFIEMHGGSITLESALGKGSRFVISLPLRPSPPRSEEALLAERASTAAG